MGASQRNLDAPANQRSHPILNQTSVQNSSSPLTASAADRRMLYRPRGATGGSVALCCSWMSPGPIAQEAPGSPTRVLPLLLSLRRSSLRQLAVALLLLPLLSCPATAGAVHSVSLAVSTRTPQKKTLMLAAPAITAWLLVPLMTRFMVPAGGMT